MSAMDTENTALISTMTSNLTAGQAASLSMPGVCSQYVKSPFDQTATNGTGNGTNPPPGTTNVQRNSDGSVLVSMNDNIVTGVTSSSRPSATLTLPQSVSTQIPSGASMVFSSATNAISPNAPYPVQDISNVYTVVFTSSSGDPLSISNLTEPVMMCFAIQNYDDLTAAQQLQYTCVFIDPTTGDMDPIVTDTSQLGQGKICCNTTHFSDFSSIGTTPGVGPSAPNSGGGITTNSTAGASLGLTLIVEFSAIIAMFVAILAFE